MKRLINWWNRWVMARAMAKDAKEREAKTQAKDAPPEGRKGISSAVLARAKTKPEDVSRGDPPKPYEPPKGVLPAGEKPLMAMDWQGNLSDYAGYFSDLNVAWSNYTFPGYPYLARLQMRPEFRRMLGTLAEEMTRKWIRITSSGDEDKTERVKELEDALKEFGVRELFRSACVMDGGFGRAQLFIHLGRPNAPDTDPDSAELAAPLVMDAAKIPKGSLKGFRTVEPIWTYPADFNTDNPLSPTFYRPQAWFVQGRKIHATRMVTIVSNPVPDILKSSFNFSGISLVQLAEPYVDDWLRTRDSVSDLVHSFSISGIATDMGAILTEGAGGEEFFNRLALFSETRDNKGVFVINKDAEEFFQFNTPLSGLDKLVAQAQERMVTPAAIPLVKYFGITPGGLNASTDGEIRVFYDHINAKQEDDWREPLSTVIRVIMLHLWGQVDEDIDFEFLPLWEPTAVEAATIRKTDADADAVLIDAGVIVPDEARERLIADPSNSYHGLESNAQALSIEDETQAREEARVAAMTPQDDPDNATPPSKSDA